MVVGWLFGWLGGGGGLFGWLVGWLVGWWGGVEGVKTDHSNRCLVFVFAQRQLKLELMIVGVKLLQ